ncbi:MAG: kinase [Clostridiales bacterium]|nr:kinase [Clostridiales bacterium]
MDRETRLARVRSFMEERGWNYNYAEEDGCGSIDFEYRGLAYHIWEFDDGECGVVTNLRHGGRKEDIFGDYESEILEIMKNW